MFTSFFADSNYLNCDYKFKEFECDLPEGKKVPEESATYKTGIVIYQKTKMSTEIFR